MEETYTDTRNDRVRSEADILLDAGGFLRAGEGEGVKVEGKRLFRGN